VKESEEALWGRGTGLAEYEKKKLPEGRKGEHMMVRIESRGRMPTGKKKNRKNWGGFVSGAENDGAGSEIQSQRHRCRETVGT